jgi:hypothetical protein
VALDKSDCGVSQNEGILTLAIDPRMKPLACLGKRVPHHHVGAERPTMSGCEMHILGSNEDLSGREGLTSVMRTLERRTMDSATR